MLEDLKSKTILWFLKGLGKDTWRRKIAVKMATSWIIKIMEEKHMTSWKTTVGGILGAIGTALQAVHDPSWMPLVGQIIGAIGIGLMGFSARDNKVSSEQAGAK